MKQKLSEIDIPKNVLEEYKALLIGTNFEFLEQGGGDIYWDISDEYKAGEDKEKAKKRLEELRKQHPSINDIILNDLSLPEYTFFLFEKCDASYKIRNKRQYDYPIVPKKEMKQRLDSIFDPNFQDRLNFSYQLYCPFPTIYESGDMIPPQRSWYEKWMLQINVLEEDRDLCNTICETLQNELNDEINCHPCR